MIFTFQVINLFCTCRYFQKLITIKNLIRTSSAGLNNHDFWLPHQAVNQTQVCNEILNPPGLHLVFVHKVPLFVTVTNNNQGKSIRHLVGCTVHNPSFKFAHFLQKVWISSLEKFLWKKKIFVWQQPAAPDSIILVVHLAFPQPSLLFSVQNLRDLIYFTWSTINYWYIMTHMKELAWPDFLNVDKFCRDYCIAFFWIRSQI